MKNLLLSAGLGLGLGLGLSGAVAADPVEGVWKTAEGEEGGFLYVAISPCGNAICGKIKTAYGTDGGVDSGYEHLGKTMIKGMAPQGDGYYKGGTIWAPDADKTYKSKMQLSGNKLEVKGCVAGGLVCRGQTWTRIR